MPERIVVSNFKTGFENDREPFLIDNDAFPVIENAVCWRGRIIRKRGTELLGRLRRVLTAKNDDGAYSTINGTNSYNIFTRLSLSSSEPYAAVVPGTIASPLVVSFAAPITNTLTDTAGTGTFTVTGAGPITSATINYATGVISITAGAAAGPAVATITMNYYPVLPVLGLEDFEVGTVNQQQMISLDKKYSYVFDQSASLFHDVNFYKVTGASFTWSGTKYQQFYSTNWLGVTTVANTAQNTGCMWITNGKPGFHILYDTYVAGTGTTDITLNLFSDSARAVPYTSLAVGDILWFNEWGTGGSTINGLSANVIAINVGGNPNRVTVQFSAVQTVAGNGISQMMTRAISGQDGIRWYDGDPTTSSNARGWVNFAPPLNAYDATNNPTPFYLVGAEIITAFKGRLMFSGVYLQTSSGTNSTVAYYPNRVVYSQVGTPFYSLPLPSLLQTNAPTAFDVAAWYQNTAGRGGFITAPFNEEIINVSVNEDVLIYMMEKKPLKLVYTFDDALPFVFQTISPEFGGQCTFSAVPLDRGVLSVGEYGFMLTDQVSNQRFDLKIPDQIYDLSVLANPAGTLNDSFMVTAFRDFRNEWVYFSYLPSEYQNGLKAFNARTLVFNYRDNSFAVFNENYTHYGTFRRSSAVTWSSLPYTSWSEWTVPWEFDEMAANYPTVAAGNQHGFVMLRINDVGEEPSQTITAVNTSTNVITSPAHGLDSGDFIQISDWLGITVTGTSTNIFLVNVIDVDTFRIYINGGSPTLTGTYAGEGVYKRYSRPLVKSKMFAPFWGASRGVRFGTQRYLLDKTPTGEITAQIFANQNDDVDLNNNTNNSYLLYSQIIPTYPERNLYGDLIYSGGQQQIWHKCNNSFTGDSIQFGITLSNDQMFDENINEQEIQLHAVALDTYPGRWLAL